MGLMKELNDLNNIYQKMYDVDEAMELTNADRKANTPAWQNRDKKHPKTGKPIYKMAGHLTAKVHVPKSAKGQGKMKEEFEVDESVGTAVDKALGAVGDTAKVAGKAAVGTAKGAAGAVKVASKVVKGVGKAAGRIAGTPVGAVKAIKKGYKSAANDESFEISSEVEKLIESGKFTEQEIEALIEAERSLGDRLHRKRKLYDKTTKKAMQFARDEGEASGHARYRMSSISREMDGIRDKMKKEK